MILEIHLRTGIHVLLPKHVLKSIILPKKRNADYDIGIETSLCGRRPNLVNRAGTVHGVKADQDGYVLTDFISLRVHQAILGLS